MKEVLLQPIKEDTSDYDRIEAAIRELFRREIFSPMIKELNFSKDILVNTRDELLVAIQSGQISFSRGTFSGRFNATLSRELVKIGAKWDRQQGVFKVSASSLPYEVKNAISVSETAFAKKLSKLEERLRKIVPEDIADKLDIAKLFDRAIFKVDRDFRKTVQNLVLSPKLTDEQRARIALEWQDNLKLPIKKFVQEEVDKLRKDVSRSVFAGNRVENLKKTLAKSYGVSANKAKFLARQETSLLMTKLKQTRYEDAGVQEYKWGCVAGSAHHPVRPSHKKLEGKTFRWDDPPITSEPGEPVRRNNPGQDFNCRCFARPIVRFK